MDNPSIKIMDSSVAAEYLDVIAQLILMGMDHRSKNIMFLIMSSVAAEIARCYCTAHLKGRGQSMHE